MPIAARYYTVADIVREFEGTREIEGVTGPCPGLDWARANPDRTVEDFEAFVQADPEIASPTIFGIIRTTGYHNNDEARSQLQRLYAGFLVKQPWGYARPWIEKLLRGDRGEPVGGFDEGAIRILVEAMAQHHPSPKGFFAQPAVLARMPASLDFTDMRSDAHPHLKGVELRGKRA